MGVVVYFSFRINTIEHDVERLKAVQVSRSKILVAVDLKESGARNIIYRVMTTSLAFLDHFPQPQPQHFLIARIFIGLI